MFPNVAKRPHASDAAAPGDAKRLHAGGAAAQPPSAQRLQQPPDPADLPVTEATVLREGTDRARRIPVYGELDAEQRAALLKVRLLRCSSVTIGERF